MLLHSLQSIDQLMNTIFTETIVWYIVHWTMFKLVCNRRPTRVWKCWFNVGYIVWPSPITFGHSLVWRLVYYNYLQLVSIDKAQKIREQINSRIVVEHCRWTLLLHKKKTKPNYFPINQWPYSRDAHRALVKLVL